MLSLNMKKAFPLWRKGFAAFAGSVAAAPTAQPDAFLRGENYTYNNNSKRPRFPSLRFAVLIV